MIYVRYGTINNGKRKIIGSTKSGYFSWFISHVILVLAKKEHKRIYLQQINTAFRIASQFLARSS